MLDSLFPGLLMGLGGTLAMDIWALVLNSVFGQVMPNWAMVGRWVGHLGRGAVFHDDIAAVAPVGGELRIGWAFHYAVGAVYGVVFLWIAGGAWLTTPTFWLVWVYSLLTIAAGWFLLQPGLGLGWAASRTAAPWKVRALGLVAHSVFAIGMFGVALALQGG